MRHWFISLPCLLLNAQGDSIQPRLEAVCIHPDHAWMIFEARVSVNGTQRFRFSDLPSWLQADRLRVRLEGPAHIRLGQVETGTEAESKPQVLPESERTIQTRRQDLALQLEVLEASLKALENLHPKDESMENYALTPKAQSELTRQLQLRHQALLEQRLRLKRDMESCSQSVPSSSVQRIQEKAGLRSFAWVELAAEKPGDVRVFLEIRTDQARWKPVYDLIWEESSGQAELAAYAVLSQTSGFAWSDVNLQVSNGAPHQNLALPALPSPVTLAYRAPYAPMPGTLEGRITDVKGRTVAGARITLISDALKFQRTQLSDANGAYRFQFLSPGTYRVVAQKGRLPETRREVEITEGATEVAGLVLGDAEALRDSIPSSPPMLMESHKSAPVAAGGVGGAGVAGSSVVAPTIIRPKEEIDDQDILEALEPAPPTYGGTSLGAGRWKVEGRHSLPADGQRRRVLLGKVAVTPKLRLRCVPSQSPEVFQELVFGPPAGIPWFPGHHLTLFRNGERLGELSMPGLDVGQPAAFGFGAKAGLKVQSQRLESKNLGFKAGKGRQWLLKDQFVLSNALDREFEVEILEPGLQSAVQSIQVEALEEASPVDRPGANGERIWKVKLPAQGQTRILSGWKITGPGTGHIPELQKLGLPSSD